MNKLLLLFLFCLYTSALLAQNELDSLLSNNAPQKEYINNAFKSTRVINGHSMEMLSAGVLDFRILHRFGSIKTGLSNMFGLDFASMRIGFDYGINKDIIIGIGRSTLDKELDVFLKYRIAHQQRGNHAMPISLVVAAGTTCTTVQLDPTRDFSSRLGHYFQIIVGRKFNEAFSLQLTPTYLRRNFVSFAVEDKNVFALGIGARYKFSKRMAFVVDYFPIFNAADYQTMPLSVGVDIETGGHVFQLHFSNSRGMNEKAFLTTTTQKWDQAEINFGFNLSRVFSIKKNQSASW